MNEPRRRGPIVRLAVGLWDAVNFSRRLVFNLLFLLVLAIVLVALGIAIINIHPPIVLFALFVLYGLSGYGMYLWRKSKGKPVSVVSTSTDEPDERGLHQ